MSVVLLNFLSLCISLNAIFCKGLILFSCEGDNQSGVIPCTHPLEMYSAITDFYQHTEKEVFSSRQIADKLQRELEHTLKQINFRTSADEILGLFSNVTLSLEDFAFRLNDLVKV